MRRTGPFWATVGAALLAAFCGLLVEGVRAADTLDIYFGVCAGGRAIDSPLPGAGQPNAACGEARRRGDDDAEDAQSIGTLVTFGAFKFIYLGDLTWNVALDLFCPRNKVGTVDAYLVTHHA